MQQDNKKLWFLSQNDRESGRFKSQHGFTVFKNISVYVAKCINTFI